MNQWFRMYAEFSTDPKIRTMSDVLQIRLVRLFCLRSSGLTEKLSCDELKYGIGCNDDETFHETKLAFQAKGFIDENWAVLNWNKRQFVSDSSTDRVNKFRAKQALKQDETFQKRDETQNETHQNRTEQNRTEQKPSRAKAARGKKTEAAKSRHAEFKAAILRYWESKNPGVEMPWGPAEGRNLEMWLRETPNTTLEQFVGYLRNRFKSAVTHTERPSRWIGNVTNFASGPIDKYGKPLQESANVGSEKNQRSPASQRVEANLRAVAETAVRRGWVSADNFERPDAAEMAEPGPGGINR
jgi:hypothetical protein